MAIADPNKKPLAPPQRSTAQGGATPLEGLLLSLFSALAATAVVEIVRTRLSPEQLAKKPWGCDVCSAWWANVFVLGAWFLASGAPTSKPALLWFGTVLLASTGISWFVLQRSKS